MARLAMSMVITVFIVLATLFNSGFVYSTGIQLDETRHTIVVAVSQLSNGSYAGVSADLYVRVTCPGSGHVYVETLPLSQIDLQAATRVAAIVASSVAGISFGSCDFYASIRADTPIIGGPSASAVTAVAFATAILRLPMNGSVVMTGMIMPDGSIGPVGGLKYKLEAAYERGAKIFLVPYGQTVDYVYRIVEERTGSWVIRRQERVPVNLVDYGKQLGVTVIPITNVYEALEIFTDGLYKPSYNASLVSKNIDRIYSELAPVLQNWIADLKDEIDRAQNESTEIEDEVLANIKQTYGYYTYIQVSEYLDNLKDLISDLIDRSRYMENTGSLYSAASGYFQALVNAYTRLYIINAFRNSTFVEKRATELREEANEWVNKIHSETGEVMNMSRFTIMISVLDRIYESLIYLNQSLSSSDVIMAASYLAYADARLYTAKLWSKLVYDQPGISSFSISAEAVKSMAMYIEILAQNIYAYILSLAETSGLQPPDELNDAIQRYSLAHTLSEDLDKLALGISSVSYMYLALVSMFQNSLDAATYTLNKTVYLNLGFLGNMLPIDVVLYLEFAKNIEEAESQVLALAKLSMMVATHKALLYLSSESNIPSSTTTPATAENLVKTVTSTITVTTMPEDITFNTYPEDITFNTYVALFVFTFLVLIALVSLMSVARRLKEV